MRGGREDGGGRGGRGGEGRKGEERGGLEEGIERGWEERAGDIRRMESRDTGGATKHNQGGEAKPNQEGWLGMLPRGLADRFQIVCIGTMLANMVIICVGAVVGGGRQRAEPHVRNTIRRRCVEVSGKTYDPAMMSF